MIAPHYPAKLHRNNDGTYWVEFSTDAESALRRGETIFLDCIRDKPLPDEVKR